MSKPKVIVTRRWPAVVEARLKELFDVTLNESDQPFSAEQLQGALKHCDCVMPTVTDPMPPDVLKVEPLRAKILGNFGVGYNHIDLEAAKSLGLTVTNTPDVLTDCTADIAMTLMLMAAGEPAKVSVRCGQVSGRAGAPPTCWAPRLSARPWD